MTVPTLSVHTSDRYEKFTFSHDTPGLLTGHTLFTADADTLVLDAFFVIEEAWDGTTPKGDVGTFTGHTGVFEVMEAAPYDMTLLETDITDNVGVKNVQYPGGSSPDANVVKFLLAAGTAFKVVVSQDGKNNGADPASTVGKATLYVLTCPA